MLHPNDLDGLKLVRGENIANSRDVERAVEEAVVQGSQGWGVVDEQSVLLAVLIELRTALNAAEDFEALTQVLLKEQNALKGKQLELGRVRKELERMTKRHAGMLDVSKAQAKEIEDLVLALSQAAGSGVD